MFVLRIEKQLDMASKSFLGQEVEVKDTQTKLTLGKKKNYWDNNNKNG